MDFPPPDYEPILLVDEETGRAIVPFCYRTMSRRAARKGLLGRSSLPEGYGLLLDEGVVHMIGMRFALDLVFLGRHWEVVKVVGSARPGLGLYGSFKARYTLELGAGQAKKLGFYKGQKLRVKTS